MRKRPTAAEKREQAAAKREQAAAKRAAEIAAGQAEVLARQIAAARTVAAGQAVEPVVAMTRDLQELNEQVARLIFGVRFEAATPLLPRYSSRVEVAMRVVRQTEAEWGWVWELTNMHEGVRRWHARVSYLPKPQALTPVAGPWARGDTLAEAICRAAVLMAGSR